MMMLLLFIFSYWLIEKYSKYYALGNYMFFQEWTLRYAWFNRISNFKLFHCESCAFFWVFVAYCYTMSVFLPFDTNVVNLYSLVAFLLHKIRNNETNLQ